MYLIIRRPFHKRSTSEMRSTKFNAWSGLSFCPEQMILSRDSFSVVCNSLVQLSACFSLPLLSLSGFNAHKKLAVTNSSGVFAALCPVLCDPTLPSSVLSMSTFRRQISRGSRSYGRRRSPPYASLPSSPQLLYRPPTDTKRFTVPEMITAIQRTVFKPHTWLTTTSRI